MKTFNIVLDGRSSIFCLHIDNYSSFVYDCFSYSIVPGSVVILPLHDQYMFVYQIDVPDHLIHEFITALKQLKAVYF